MSKADRVSVEITLPQDTLCQLAIMAHERDITLNDLINDILKDYIARHPLNEAAPKSWICKVESTPDGELMLPFPEDLIAAMGWNVGDSLTWKDLGDGSFGLSLAPDSGT